MSLGFVSKLKHQSAGGYPGVCVAIGLPKCCDHLRKDTKLDYALSKPGMRAYRLGLDQKAHTGEITVFILPLAMWSIQLVAVRTTFSNYPLCNIQGCQCPWLEMKKICVVCTVRSGHN